MEPWESGLWGGEGAQLGIILYSPKQPSLSGSSVSGVLHSHALYDDVTGSDVTALPALPHDALTFRGNPMVKNPLSYAEY